MNHLNKLSSDPIFESKLCLENAIRPQLPISIQQNMNISANHTYSLEQPQYLKPKLTENQHNSSRTNKPNKHEYQRTRNKSTKRNLLSCQQILEIAKKRQTHSGLSAEPNATYRQSGKNRKQVKKKKQEHNQSHGNLGKFNGVLAHNMKTVFVDKVKKEKNVSFMGLSQNTFANYPLSQSNSLIVFSDKESTLNSTDKARNQQVFGLPAKMADSKKKTLKKLENRVCIASQVMERDNGRKDLCNQSRVQQHRRNHCAIVIQKHWRGYMTRKLLQHCIVREQFKLKQALKQCYSSNQALSAERDHNKSNYLHSNSFLESRHSPYTYSSQLNQQAQNFEQFINKISHISDPQNSMSDMKIRDSINNHNPFRAGDNEFDHAVVSSQTPENAQSKQLSSFDTHTLEQRSNASDKLLSELDQQSHTVYHQYRKTPVIMKNEDEYHSLMKQLRKSEVGEFASQQLHSSEDHSGNNSEISSEIPMKNKENKILNDSSRSPHKKITIDPIKSSSNSSSQSKPAMINTENSCIQSSETLTQKVLHDFNNYISCAKQQLTYKLRSNSVQFDQMLEIRNSISTISNNLQHMFEQVKMIIVQCLYKVKALIANAGTDIKSNDSEEEFKCRLEISGHLGTKQPVKVTKNQIKRGVIQSVFGPQTVQMNDEIMLPTSTSKIGGASDSELSKCYSPVSEYYTLELPTEELSPHRDSHYSLGLQSLKMYLQNIYEQYKTQHPNNESQTAFLCQILKRHSEMGAQNMMERCLIQLLVDIVTGKHRLEDLILAVESYQLLLREDISAKRLLERIEDGGSQQEICVLKLINKWVKELDKWELGPIQEVSCHMQESCNISQNSRRNNSPVQP